MKTLQSVNGDSELWAGSTCMEGEGAREPEWERSRERGAFTTNRDRSPSEESSVRSDSLEEVSQISVNNANMSGSNTGAGAMAGNLD
ncbi:hypothetical protein V501_02720 [Pseudogymnoascus sp. VKM F-4519 (FW-2642)]|nr:hypothetical protein V501_02720 [Pseudogymnoascus sp. VKM F-4519 (FW-2642)]